ncbi:MAG: hypothetical protein KDB14_06555, partial [Planctomycetales bacterium]|nr:hypothetical protein [Planctomycetales bacterium]
SHRRRQLVADLADTFLFTRTHDVWECTLPNGHYRVTLCIGDAGHEQLGQNVTLEGQPLCRHVDTEAGAFLERQADIRLTDKRLTLEIGLPGGDTNTCLNWILIEELP